MRLIVLLFAVAAVDTSNAVNAVNAVQNNNMGTRFLRTYETADNEERVGLTEIAGKLTKSSSLKTLLAEVDTLEAQLHQSIASNKDLFTQIEKMVDSPYQLREKLGISAKLEKMTSAQLNNDMDYHLWLEYSKWWKGTYGKDLGF